MSAFRVVRQINASLTVHGTGSGINSWNRFRGILEPMSRAAQLSGAQDIDRMFPGGSPMTTTPWQGMGRRRDVKDYDQERVRHVLLNPQQHPMVHIDPADVRLRATQPSITRAGVQHYLGDDYAKHGTTYADQHNAGNVHPVVYAREDGQHLLLSGHHRAAAALLQGRQFPVRLVEGPWGGPRRSA